MVAPRAASVRFPVDPGDVPASKAARRMGLTEAEFLAKLPELFRRGFPRPDETTGMFDLEAIDAWRRSRNPHLFGLSGALTGPAAALDARTGIVRRRLEAKRWAG